MAGGLAGWRKGWNGWVRACSVGCANGRDLGSMRQSPSRPTRHWTSNRGVAVHVCRVAGLDAACRVLSSLVPGQPALFSSTFILHPALAFRFCRFAPLLNLCLNCRGGPRSRQKKHFLAAMREYILLGGASIARRMYDAHLLHQVRRWPLFRAATRGTCARHLGEHRERDRRLHGCGSRPFFFGCLGG